MALTKEEKKNLVENYRNQIQNSDAVFVLHPKGITPNEVNELKKQLFDNNASFNVIKNSLFKLALKESDVNVTIEEGENAVIFAQGDFSVVAKAIDEFMTDTEKAEFRTGLIQGSIITKDQFVTLSSLPPREVLLAQVLSGMQATITGFVRVLNGNLSGFVNVVNAIKDQKA